MHRHLALLACALTVAGCSSPGGNAYFAPGADADVVDAVLFPDATVRDTAPEQDTLPPEDTAPELDTAPIEETFAPDTWTPPDTSEPADTEPADTEPADTEPADTFTTFCKNGDPCNDDDPCTVNDRCVDNHCAGDSIACDDQIPCTLDSCVDGQCRSATQDGYCLIGGACWTEAQNNPVNPCQRCAHAANAAGWTNSDGAACDDGDPCTEGEACAAGACGGGATPAEVCDDGADNDCNGQTDAADVACGGVAACAYHEDCYPERVCARWATTGEAVCSDPCIGASDCPTGQICSKLPGSAQIAFCQPALPGGLPNGSACSVDGECASALCADDFCRATCLAESRCSEPGFTCHPVGDLSIGVISGACAPNPPGSIPNGQICGSGDSSLCASGQCDLMPPSGPWPCRELCQGESACAPTQECNLVLYAPGESADAMPFATVYTTLSHDALTACYTPKTPGGSLSDGAPCVQTAYYQCRSNKCFNLAGPGEPDAFYCTTYCEFDAECPGGMVCKPTLTNLVSDWLKSPWFYHQDPAPGAYTLVRVCKPE